MRDVQDKKLKKIVATSVVLCWKNISESLGESEQDCISRYLNLSQVTNRAMDKYKPWQKKEDDLLTKIVSENGAK